MKLTIKTTLYIYFCFSLVVGQVPGENYKVFNKLISETKIQDYYSINEIREIFESPLLIQEPMVLERFNKKPEKIKTYKQYKACLLYTSPSPRDATLSRMPSSA